MRTAPAQLHRQAPRRRRHAPTRRKRRLGWRGRLLLFAVLCGWAVAGWAVLARATGPRGNTEQAHFDAIVVLGRRLDADGNPTPALLARVTEGVHEYERGVASRLILTGGVTRPPFGDEATVMARVAEAQGVPSSAIFREPAAMDTIENACYSVRVMKAHGWNSAEIVTTPGHLPRAGIIFSRMPIEWRMHAAPLLEQVSAPARVWGTSEELLKTVRYLLYARWTERCSP